MLSNTNTEGSMIYSQKLPKGHKSHTAPS